MGCEATRMRWKSERSGERITVAVTTYTSSVSRAATFSSRRRLWREGEGCGEREKAWVEEKAELPPVSALASVSAEQLPPAICALKEKAWGVDVKKPSPEGGEGRTACGG